MCAKQRSDCGNFFRYSCRKKGVDWSFPKTGPDSAVFSTPIGKTPHSPKERGTVRPKNEKTIAALPSSDSPNYKSHKSCSICFSSKILETDKKPQCKPHHKQNKKTSTPIAPLLFAAAKARKKDKLHCKPPKLDHCAMPLFSIAVVLPLALLLGPSQIACRPHGFPGDLEKAAVPWKRPKTIRPKPKSPSVQSNFLRPAPKRPQSKSFVSRPAPTGSPVPSWVSSLLLLPSTAGRPLQWLRRWR